MSNNSSREEVLFEEAVKRASEAERAAYLDEACRGNPEMRARLELLLEGYFKAGEFLPEQAESRPAPADEAIGSVIGRYKLLEKIGEGGFGAVYLAEQKEPVKRRVALKIIKLGMDTKQVVARFEAERQALALMDHPNIAKVFDGGMTESPHPQPLSHPMGEGGPRPSEREAELATRHSPLTTHYGRPYFVMELVRGVPITKYCDENDIAPHERLQLFMQVCQAVQHAHQKGIIHRDLKPSNILVTVNDGVAVPKVIDFGVAKATQQELTEKTILTQFHHFIGTPAYMSPEQAEMTSVDIDTRSDIYSLGVLLYELLTGKPPFDGKELLASGFDEMRRTIREKEPVKPSTRLRREAGSAQSQIVNRKSQIDPDLDWIVMKCLEKDRNRRYETANGLAADISRHFNNEPVIARPPSRLYEFQKTVRRHKFGFAATAAILLALATGVAVATWQAVRAREAEREQARLRAQAQEAESRKTEELGKSLLAFARASRLSGEPGRRFASLEAITKAAAIRQSLELRNEAIAALALTDLCPPQVWPAAFPTRDWNWDRNFDFDSDLMRYAVGRPDKAISICRVSDQQELFRIPPAKTEGRALLFSPDGKWLAVRQEDGSLRVWDLERRVTTVEAQLDGNLSWSLDFSPDSQRLVAGSTNNSVLCFDVAAGLETNSLRVSVSPAHLLFDPRGKVLAVHDGMDCELWDWEHRKLLRTLSPPRGSPKPRAREGPITAWAWHPDGVRFATGSDDEEFRFWDTRTGSDQILRQPNRYVARLTFSPRGDLLVTYGWDSTTRVWDAQTGQPMLSSEGGYAWRFSRDGGRLAFFRDNGEFGVWPVVLPRIFRTLNMRVPLREVYGGCAFSPDGRFLIWGQADELRWANLISGEVGYQELANARLCAFRPDGKSLLTTSTEGLMSWPVARETEAGNLSLRLGPPTRLSTRANPFLRRAAISGDGQTMIVGATNQWSVIEPGGIERVIEISGLLRIR